MNPMCRVALSAGAAVVVLAAVPSVGAGQEAQKPASAQQEPVLRRFDDLDSNRNGRIESSEWRLSRQAFASVDTNGDGVISREELAAAEQPNPDPDAIAPAYKETVVVSASRSEEKLVNAPATM